MSGFRLFIDFIAVLTVFATVASLVYVQHKFDKEQNK